MNYHLLFVAFFTFIFKTFFLPAFGSYASSSSSEGICLDISQNSLEPSLKLACDSALYQKIWSDNLLLYELLLMTRHSKFSVHWSMTWQKDSKVGNMPA